MGGGVRGLLGSDDLRPSRVRILQYGYESTAQIADWKIG